MSESIGNIISRKKYLFLKGFSKSLSEEELKQIEEYEDNEKKNAKVYTRKTPKEKPKPIESLEVDSLKKVFLKNFEEYEGKKLIITDDNKKIYSALCLYFAKDKGFEDTGVTENDASLEKGLFIIGGVGCGKTSALNTFQRIGKNIYKKQNDMFMYFYLASCNAVVKEYEAIEKNSDKDLFFKKYNRGVCYFDDFGTESEASNYGKVNLMKDILEERYNQKSKTYITSNLSLEEILDRYGRRVFDRIIEQYNIIIWNSESFRK